MLNVLELRADWRARDFEHKLRSALHPASAAAVFAASEPQLMPERFVRFASSALDGYEPIRAVLWAPAVAASARPEFERHMSLAANRSFRIVELTAEGLRPATPREQHLPVLAAHGYVTEDVPATFGVDLLADPVRRAAVLRARDTGQPVATPPVRGLLPPELLWFVHVPVYDSTTLPADVEERRLLWRGSVVGSFELARLLDIAVENTPEILGQLRVAVRHDGETSPGRVLAAYNAARHAFDVETNASNGAEARQSTDALRLVREFVVASQHWTLLFEFPAPVAGGLAASKRWFWPAAIMCLTALLLVCLRHSARHGRTVELAVAERTAALAALNRQLEHEVERCRRTVDRSRQSGEMLKVTIDAAPNAIISMDAERRIVLWNPAAERVFGYTAAEATGRPYKLLVPSGGEPQHDAFFRTVSTGGRLTNEIATRRRKDGTEIMVRFSGSGVFAADGRFTGAVFALEDVTRERLIEEQLRQSQKMEAIGNLTGGIAHDFNNMLAVVIGNLDLLVEQLDTNGAPARNAGQALDAALRGAELVKRLLAFSRRQPLKSTEIDFAAAIEAVAPLLRRTLGDNIVIELSLDPRTGTVAVDRNQLENAVLNLAINARDAMPGGGRILIATRRQTVNADNAPMYPDLSPGEYACLSLTDSGTGIAPEILARVFEPFFTTKAEGKGTGLGLAMVYGFVRQSGGTVKIYSEPGHGTNVRLCFPISTVRAVDAGGADQATLPPTGNERILVVDDREELRAVAVNTLERLGYRVTACASGDEAMARLSAGEAVDLVFTDIIMPGAASGLDLARAVRERHRDCAVLLTSGFAIQNAITLQAEQLGLTVIAKPYRAIDLARAVRTALESRRTEASG